MKQYFCHTKAFRTACFCPFFVNVIPPLPCCDVSGYMDRDPTFQGVGMVVEFEFPAIFMFTRAPQQHKKIDVSFRGDRPRSYNH